MIESWSIPGAGGEAILGNTHRPAGPPRGVIVLCHGFKGYKDYGFFPHLTARCAEAGFVAVRFNFSHSGMTNRTQTFERPDLFERDTWGKQVEDLACVAASLRDDPALRELPVVLFGHSRGGVAALLSASRDPTIAGVVTAAAPSEACSLDEDQKAMLRRTGWIASPSSRTGQDLRVGRAWLDEIEADPDAVDPKRAIAAIRAPVLILHGDADPTVPVEAANQLHEASGRRARLLVMAGANHTFNCPNPMPAVAPAETARMIDAVLAFAGQIRGGCG